MKPSRAGVRTRHAAAVLAACLALAGCSTPPVGARPSAGPWPSTTPPAPGTRTTAPEHVLVVVFENKASTQIDGSRQAPYLNALATHSAVYPNTQATTHPSQPNYLALFSGDTQGVTSDRCPVRLHGRDNLARQLLDAGETFTGYAEGLPRPGYTGCSSGRYAAKHNPWVDFDTVPAELNQPASALPADFATLPTVAFLVPDLCHDMHDCPVANGDVWAQRELDGYARWAVQHNSLLILTFDEDDRGHHEPVYTLLCGAGIRPGRVEAPITQYGLLATIEDWYHLPRLGHARQATSIAGSWNG